MAEERMDVDAQLECLNRALRLQHRSVLHYSLVAGSVIGLEYRAHAEKMREHSLSELEDATRLVEKITALGGEPTAEAGVLGASVLSSTIRTRASLWVAGQSPRSSPRSMDTVEAAKFLGSVTTA